MMLSFVLTMPNVGSWNGKWSGQNDLYARVIGVSPSRVPSIIANSPYRYSWNDGWSACVTVSVTKEPQKIRRQSKGFCGYDWMIDSIISDLRIIAPSDRKLKEIRP
jgi:hypothetical protein